MRAPAARTPGSASIAFWSPIVSGGLCRHWQVASVPSQAANVIGKRDRKNVLGPAASRSFADALVDAVHGRRDHHHHEHAHRDAEDRERRRAPCWRGWSRRRCPRPRARSEHPRIEECPHVLSCLRAAIGSSRAARLAGYTPAMMPTPAPTDTPSERPTRARRPAGSGAQRRNDLGKAESEGDAGGGAERGQGRALDEELVEDVTALARRAPCGCRSRACARPRPRA